MKNIDIAEQITELFVDVLEVEPDDIELDSSVVDDLGADSLDIVDISFSLGKKLDIKMPQQTVLMHAEVIFGGSEQLFDKGKITALGAELLRAGPNGYTEEEVYEGKPLFDIYSGTTVRHWINLCNAIIESGLSGDELIESSLQPLLQRKVA